MEQRRLAVKVDRLAGERQRARALASPIERRPHTKRTFALKQLPIYA